MPRLVLDTGPLGRIAHPSADPANSEILRWLVAWLRRGAEVFVPEIADYELRRELLRAGLQASVERLDQLKRELHYLPLTTPVMLQAAAFWAEARKNHQPAAPRDALDGDMILAAQATSVGATIATENVEHLARFADARHWREITS